MLSDSYKNILHKQKNNCVPKTVFQNTSKSKKNALNITKKYCTWWIYKYINIIKINIFFSVYLKI